MIHRITVDGFRSLSRFDLDVRPGLNILVGPNGSGKTNIIEFFQFLSFLARNELSRALSMSGGAGSVFAKAGRTSYGKTISAAVYGRVPALQRGNEPPAPDIRYIYAFEIEMSEALDQVYFRKQTFRASTSTSEPDLFNKQGAVAWDIDVVQTVGADLQPQVDIKVFRDERFSRRGLLSTVTRLASEKADRSSNAKENLARFLEDRSAAEVSIIDNLSVVIYELRTIIDDIAGGEILNIVPSNVKQPEDSATPWGIKGDGSGLAATLFSLRRHNTSRFYRYYASSRAYESRRMPRRPHAIYSQIEQYLTLVNPTIDRMIIDNDTFNNQIKVSFAIHGMTGEVILPISSMSDGTVKWLALITAILTYGSIFAIEEPENFLHPLMQKEILKIMREDTRRRAGHSFIIMTTHSETLLNAADPEEVVVVFMDNGVTRASRSADPEALRRRIRETGFGLGFFYLTGALDDA